MRNFTNVLMIAAIAGCVIAVGFGTWTSFLYPIIRSEQSFVERQDADNARYSGHAKPKPKKYDRPVADAKTESVADAEIDNAMSESFAEIIQLRFVSWNVESGGNDPRTIAEQIRQFADCHIVALQEVRGIGQFVYNNSLHNHSAINGQTGSSDHLQILYNSNRLKLLQESEPSEFESHRFNNGRHQSPLIALFRDKVTSVEFYFVTVHLAPGDAELRTEQATGLREWARAQTLPVVAIGDFNFDYDFNTQTGNDGFNAMLRDNVWHWVKPDPLIDTNWSDRNNDGIDDFPDSMLDFAFVANGAKEWNCSATVVVRDGDFPDDEKTADHRPVLLLLSPPVK